MKPGLRLDGFEILSQRVLPSASPVMSGIPEGMQYHAVQVRTLLEDASTAEDTSQAVGSEDEHAGTEKVENNEGLHHDEEEKMEHLMEELAEIEEEKTEHSHEQAEAAAKANEAQAEAAEEAAEKNQEAREEANEHEREHSTEEALHHLHEAHAEQEKKFEEFLHELQHGHHVEHTHVDLGESLVGEHFSQLHLGTPGIGHGHEQEEHAASHEQGHDSHDRSHADHANGLDTHTIHLHETHKLHTDHHAFSHGELPLEGGRHAPETVYHSSPAAAGAGVFLATGLVGQGIGIVLEPSAAGEADPVITADEQRKVDRKRWWLPWRK